ncbi:endoglucanase-like [Anoplophora glabripennis]|uniref:endoglucanase-like n=1 Tax=Anoplophora glabripennis TaxID=217634 RepID=UPI00087522AC|nr:endoglucanase-like [Anoplophora glabripennis]
MKLLLVTLVALCTVQGYLSDLHNVKPVHNGVRGTSRTTRYWDCCKPSCSWTENLRDKSGAPVKSCTKDGKTQADRNMQSACGTGTGSYMCSDQQPRMVNSTFALGYVAASFTGGIDTKMCCACLRLVFQGGLSGKQMVVQITNTGGDLGSNHFDISMPGGGVGIFTKGCSSQWGCPSTGWGDQYGGVRSEHDCAKLPTDLREGCKFRFHFMQGVSNPDVTFEQVECPSEIVSITGCKY